MYLAQSIARRAAYDPHTASGPPCQICGCEMVMTTASLWCCVVTSACKPIPRLMGLDLLDSARLAAKMVRKAAVIRESDAIDDRADLLSEILSELG